MRAATAVAVCILLMGSACGESEEVPEVRLPDLDSRDLARAALSVEDMGSGWEVVEGATPNTIQIGGDVGAANVTSPVADATTAFRETEGPGFVSNSVYMVSSERVAGAIITAHREVADQTTWSQEREDGGAATFVNSGTVGGLGRLGDEMFSARLDVTIAPGSGDETTRAVEYVVFREGPIVSFVVAQDAPAAPFVIKHADKIRSALAAAGAAGPR